MLVHHDFSKILHEVTGQWWAQLTKPHFPGKNLKLSLKNFIATFWIWMLQYKVGGPQDFSNRTTSLTIYNTSTGGNQHWSYTKHDQLKHEKICLSPMNHVVGSVVLMVPCDGENPIQKWNYKEREGQLFNMVTKMCLDAGLTPGKEVVQRPCASTRSQKWIFQTV